MDELSKISNYQELNGKRARTLQAAVWDTMRRNAES